MSPDTGANIMKTPARATFLALLALLASAASAQPVISVSVTPPFNAGAVAIGTPASGINVRLDNIGTSALVITNVQISGAPFTFTTTSGSCDRGLPGSLTVAANSSCQMSVTFTPTAVGVANGTYTLTDNASGSPQTFALTGTGMIPSAYVPSTTLLVFGPQALGTTSAPQTITLSNPGTFYSLGTTGGQITGDFAQTNDCGGTLATLSSCHFFVTFTPTAPGPRTGTLNFCPDCNFATTDVSLQGGGGVGGVADVPALSKWALAALAALLSAGGLLALARRT
jgi:hypothetical protein